ncbi:DUF6298 domain-containing protein [Rufibacter tibetensis]|uniref:Pectate lyase n=1 Tax=Rufibacter tibetensis TaxID=512763 RepID=A0A0P0D3E0_9BACT|nr:DUF6298 domain-containing protein [Rufibacter tibetensis]ALJ01632.1 pectate lyase [Rufibacter tibetensis]
MNCNSSTFPQIKLLFYLIGFFALLSISAFTQVIAQTKLLPPVSVDAAGRLVYTPDAQGNRVPDFSYSGYMAGEQPIPDVPIRVVVPVINGDATHRIQAALDYVASLPKDRNGIRGAVLLEKGTHEVSGGLKIKTSGVVLRGSGMGAGGTVLLGSGQDRQTLLSIAGKDNRELKPAVKVTDGYVPVNASEVHVASPHSFKAGDQVLVHRPSTQEWIDVLDANDFGGNLGYIGWKPGERDIFWDRTIVAVKGTAITLDAPITTALDQQYGGGNVVPYNWSGRISQVGVENLTCRSTYDTRNPKDEAHRWMAITMENVSDAWVRQVVFEHFAGSAVAVLETAKRITVEDCKSLAPVSEIGGHRRYTFFTLGQQTLFQRLYAEYGYHDFAVGYCAAGPNAFVQCQSYLPYSFSGAIDSWASGILFDVVNVDGQALSLKNRMQEANGAGWSGANSMLWQCSASRIDCYKPPTANNWAFGVWAQFAGNGFWHEENSHITPYSLYYAQLSDRIGAQASERAQLQLIETNATSSPTVEQAAALTALAVKPGPVLSDWIDQASTRRAIPVNASAAKTIDKIGYKAPVPTKQPVKKGVQVQNGWLVHGKAVLTGKQYTVPWWRGTLQPLEIKKSKPHLTRYVPGRNGIGLTDELDEVARWMQAENMVAMDHNYGLWYDRRRDDHERVRRMDGEVWAPFYELPYARSGQGTAWDGLSKYDLTKFNYWYWSRLKQFADIADQKGLVLLHQNYFQHNILEAGAHYADFPWRTANNINGTGFPEPPPYAGEKRIFLAEQFYDIKDPVRRELHKAYIRKCLESFAGNTSVIQLISAEYTGPLAFTQFWIDTILEWEKETGKKANVGLSVTKDVQDAILSDPVRAAAVDLIDIRYWWYREDGSVYSPVGGQNLAPRQYARLNKPGKNSFESVYRTVQEFRERYPEKAVVYSAGGHDNHLAWGAFMAGGSLASLPPIREGGFLADAASMKPVSFSGTPPGQWFIGNGGKGYIVYSDSANPVMIDLSGHKGMYKARWIDPKDGHTLKKMEQVKGGKTLALKSPKSGPVVLWLTK